MMRWTVFGLGLGLFLVAVGRWYSRCLPGAGEGYPQHASVVVWHLAAAYD